MENKQPLLKLIAAFAAVYIIWGSTYLAIHFAIKTMPPFLMAGVRFIIAGAFLLLLAAHRNKLLITKEHWKSGFILGGFLLLGGNGGVVFAQQFISSGLTALLVSTVPIWIVLLMWILPGGVRPKLKTIFGVLLGFSGLFLLIDITPENGSLGDSLIGSFSVLLGACSWAFGSLYSGKAVLPKSKFASVAVQMLGGGVLLLILSFFTGEMNEFNISNVSYESFFALLYLIFIGAVIGYTAYIWLLGSAGPEKASTYAYVNPVVAVFLGWIFANEVITLNIIIGAAIILTAVAMINSNLFEIIKKVIPYKKKKEIVK